MMLTFLAPFFVFAVVVLVHEAGHFITAKITGMKVEEFAIGFGPKLFGIQKGETLYSLRVLPLGGYNKITGMVKDGTETDSRAFVNRPVGARLLVLCAGAICNLLLAFLIFFFTFWSLGIQTFPNLPRISGVVEHSAADVAGMQKGDTILSIDGNPVKTWEDIGTVVSPLGKRVISIDIQRDNTVHTLTVIPEESEEGYAILGIHPYTEYHEIGVGKALYMAWDRSLFIVKMMAHGFTEIFSGESEGLAGPIGVARMSGTVAESGWVALFLFIALLSLNLGILNLLPIPLLDGGLIILTILEAIRGKELPERALYYIQAIGITILGSLFIYATAQDLIALFQ